VNRCSSTIDTKHRSLERLNTQREIDEMIIKEKKKHKEKAMGPTKFNESSNLNFKLKVTKWLKDLHNI